MTGTDEIVRWAGDEERRRCEPDVVYLDADPLSPWTVGLDFWNGGVADNPMNILPALRDDMTTHLQTSTA